MNLLNKLFPRRNPVHPMGVQLTTWFEQDVERIPSSDRRPFLFCPGGPPNPWESKYINFDSLKALGSESYLVPVRDEVRKHMWQGDGWASHLSWVPEEDLSGGFWRINYL